jgi:hypothetical protein
MAERSNDIRDPKYIIKRLRNSGYRADLFIGNPDQHMRDDRLAEIVAKSFDENSQSTPKDIFKALKENRLEFSRALSRVPDYSLADSREWTILIDGGDASVLLTLYRNCTEEEDFIADFFELYDGNQYIRPYRLKVGTESFEVLAETLHEMGIQNKVDTYPDVLLKRIEKIKS